MPLAIHAVGREDVPPLSAPDRLRTEVAYFCTPEGEPNVPSLGPHEFFIRLEHSAQWLDEGVVLVISPLDAAARAEVELSEAHEAFLEWLVRHGVEHVRLH